MVHLTRGIRGAGNWVWDGRAWVQWQVDAGNFVHSRPSLKTGSRSSGDRGRRFEGIAPPLGSLSQSVHWSGGGIPRTDWRSHLGVWKKAFQTREINWISSDKPLMRNTWLNINSAVVIAVGNQNNGINLQIRESIHNYQNAGNTSWYWEIRHKVGRGTSLFGRPMTGSFCQNSVVAPLHEPTHALRHSQPPEEVFQQREVLVGPGVPSAQWGVSK